ncbi:MAG: hypothetical protein HC800_04155 [Phormidesmis sp. RL_2_1]|nr:hypothetical protein [Phormidesmis sp. RL_2_1]
MTTWFYWRISLYRFLCIAGPLALLGAGMAAASETIVNRFFAAESQGGGTLGWRLEHAWVPTINYTMEHSPLFGFGSRGWEFVAELLNVIDPLTDEVVPSHSGYVWAFVAWGALGALTYVGFLVVLLFEAFKLSMVKNKEVATTGRALLCSVVGYCLWAFISNVMWPQGWLILISLAILIACLKVTALTTLEDT